MYEDKCYQLIDVVVKANKADTEAFIKEFNADEYAKMYCTTAEWTDYSDDEQVIRFDIRGKVKYYPSNSYYDPDEYEYDEQFLSDDCDDVVKDWFFGKPFEVLEIKFGEIEHYMF